MSRVERKIISFAQNFFKNSLNQSVIRDHLGNCLVNNVIVSGDVLMAELYNNIQEGFYYLIIIIDAMVTPFCMFNVWKVINFLE